MGRRRKARELALQVLFHLEFSPDDPSEVFDLLCKHFHSRTSIRPFSLELVRGVCENREQLDRVITQASENWRLDRMSRLDRCVLRLAAFEMLFMEEIPPKVSIDEAVELGKRFGGEDSASFVNGVLDHIYNTHFEEGRLKPKEV
jgi:transcription antitermination factor NusB